MPAFDSAVRQVGDLVVVALLLFGLTSVVAPLDVFLSSVGVDAPWFAGLVAAALIALALLLARPLRLRLVARVWGVGLVVTALWIPLFGPPRTSGKPGRYSRLVGGLSRRRRRPDLPAAVAGGRGATAGRVSRARRGRSRASERRSRGPARPVARRAERFSVSAATIRT
ncbi:hypothetical protein C438_08202 [Haloferax denitrificans ATCC 35960]|uniref:Uncharacterized protein n=1 Tax=Haloferax denitrificans ATCC 35960 TaxID=662478 RepID=M0JCP6_9EURY|nr:hypothetical protein [Haloferax denitrificans]EMA05794.1 hypothetical protein C438_08202 [Haloferax denitrificans ATCC 35960]